MSYQKDIERIKELLTLCQQLQSERDGVNRPDPGSVDKTKTLDKFAIDINESITYVSYLYKLLPMSSELTRLGRLLKKGGKITLECGDSFSSAALDYILAQYGLKKE